MTTFPITYGSSDISDTGIVPKGIPLDGNGAWRPLPNGYSNGTTYMKDEPTPGPGHNHPTFDEAAKANLKRGVHLTHLEVIVRAIDDPRLDMCALQVLAHIIKHMNGKSGVAYPGRERLATEITYHVNGEPRHYSPKVVGNAVSKLIRCGYLISTKRAPRPGAHAVSHYTAVYPLTIEEWWVEIEVWCRKKRAEERREFPKPADVTPEADVIAGDDVTTGDDVIAGDDVRVADVIAGNAADVIAGNENRRPSLYTELEPMNLCADAPDASRSPDGKTNPKSAWVSPKRATPAAAPPAPPAAAAVTAYNEAAYRHGFSRCEILTEKRRKRLTERLADIGGLDAFKLALTAIPADRFLMGRLPAKAGSDPFKLTIDRLMQTEGGMGDVLARLIDAAAAAKPRANAPDEEAELAATLARMRAEEGWQ